MDDLQSRIEQTTAAYNDALAKVADIEQQIQANRDKIADLEAKLPAQRAAAQDAVKSLYKMNSSSSGLIGMLLSADDFNKFIQMLQYLGVVQNHNVEALEALEATQTELQSTNELLNSQRASAQREAEDAKRAQADAQAARDAFAAELAEKAKAEEAERQAAEARVQQALAANSNTTFTTASGQTDTVQAPSAPIEDVVPTTEKDAFINEWAPRIDAFMTGSPMAGTGRIFAEAAYETGADPRFSPAISLIESGRGASCFLPYNAWGWGSVSWGSWEEAIWAHVRGLARGYDGGHLTYAGARKYCPPNTDFWYNNVAAAMNRI